ncbi:hypothetical protein V6U90_26530 [Micromonospora sp. CPCC 206060]|uniref:hypothetical protein n=1 Tax=Micromonospora sp. CPCC 206060 TaxID=3122406 RepID=UPI002FEEA5F1
MADAVPVVPAAVRAISTVVTGLPPMLPGAVEGLLDPVVSLTDRLLDALLPPAAACPVDSGPARPPVPAPGPPRSEVGGGADQGQSTPVPPNPVLARTSLWSPWPPMLVMRQPASGPAVGGAVVVGPAGPSPPGTLDRSGDPDGEYALTADRGTGSGPMVHRGWRWLPDPVATGPVAPRSTAVVGRSPAVVARPG